ncbi:MAG: hypothetical protein JXR96_10445 [Deltaproteobacteria bacterium]|nr:hypothetical protein [Deltaproteobacteria bacterium]
MTRARSRSISALGLFLTWLAWAGPSNAGPKLVLDEQFSHNRNRWPGSRIGYIFHNAFHIYNKEGFYVVSMDPTFLKRYAFRNGKIEVQATWKEGVRDKGFGILFRSQDIQNCYYFSISAEGKFSVGYLEQGAMTVLVDWTAASEIQPDGANLLQVECREGSFTGYINQKQVFSVSDSHIQGELFALMADQGVHAIFDNLKVWRDKTRPADVKAPRKLDLTAREKTEQQKMLAALDGGDGRYFGMVGWRLLERINLGQHTTAIHEFSVAEKEKIVSKIIPALIGGFKNRDKNVRRAIYRELCFGRDENLLHSIDFNLLYGEIVKQKDAKATFERLYDLSFAQRPREQGDREVWQAVVDLGVYCKYALMDDQKLRQVMLDTGIKPMLQVYFHKIMWEHLQRVNNLPGTQETFLNRSAKKDSQNLAQYMWTYMGGLRNADPRVRKAIYAELLFPGIDEPLKRIESHKNGKKWLMKFRLLLQRREEEDEEARPLYDQVKALYSEK